LLRASTHSFLAFLRDAEVAMTDIPGIRRVDDPSRIGVAPADGDANTFAVVGRLIVEFARAEAYVHLLTCRRSGLGDIAARPIFSGMRLGDLSERLRETIRLKEQEEGEYTDIDSCLTQLDVIGKQRHKIAHRYVELGTGTVRTSNLYTSKKFYVHEDDEFTLEDIEKMIDDCLRIRRRILRHTDGEARRRERYDPSFLPALFAPWQYKSPLRGRMRK
jgi:hypothetical protein